MPMSPEAAAEIGRIGAVAAMALSAVGSGLGAYLGGAGAPHLGCSFWSHRHPFFLSMGDGAVTPSSDA